MTTMGKPHDLVDLLNHRVDLSFLDIHQLSLFHINPLTQLIKSFLNLGLRSGLLFVDLSPSLFQPVRLLIHFLNLGGDLNL